ncbi:MAG: phosphotransferase [Deinococcales bacterium]
MRDARVASGTLTEALSAWGTLRVVRPLGGGNRGGAVLVHGTTPQSGSGAGLFVAKPTTRAADAVVWAARIQRHARDAGFEVPAYRRSRHGRFVEGGFTLEAYVEGRPSTMAERAAALRDLSAFHEITRGMRQRPGFAGSAALLRRSRGGDVDLRAMPADLVHLAREAWRPFASRPTVAVHGDLNADNVLATPAGRLALIDWDECRLDASVFDEAVWLGADRDARAWAGAASASGVEPDATAVQRAVLAWEVAACWTAEPEHAFRLAERLRGGDAAGESR